MIKNMLVTGGASYVGSYSFSCAQVSRRVCEAFYGIKIILMDIANRD